ncbi:hypothetical protein [Sphingomonas qomolangmaensis]|uniref:hypothetical protein n=1 Tax=Sphingomonas qomolangmaensis TaxID=2918765 RepID=UPI003873249D
MADSLPFTVVIPDLIRDLLMDAPEQVRRDAGVDRAVALAGDDVDRGDFRHLRSPIVIPDLIRDPEPRAISCVALGVGSSPA